MNWPKSTLRNRVTVTLLGFTAATALTVGLLGQWVNETIEHAIWTAILEAELSYYLERFHSNPAAALPQTANLHTYVRRLDGETENGVPAEFRDLGPGVHDELRVDQTEYCVLVRDAGPFRIYMAFDISHVEESERRLSLIVILGIAVLGLAVFAISVWLAGRLVAPVQDLARRVSRLDPAARGLRLGNHYCDSEIATIARAFDQYLERLDGFVEREQEFTATASHELRTPIAVIAGATEILCTIPDLPEAAQRALARIHRATRNMTETISTLLYLAREGMSQGAETCQLDELLPEIVDDHRHLLQGKDLVLKLTHIEPTLLAAPARVVDIAVANLVRNAIQHTVSGRIEIALQDDRLTVIDSGEGISPEKLDKIFQADGRRKGGRSGGLGLYIIERLCARFGWSIAIDSRPGGGTRVCLDFGARRAG